MSKPSNALEELILHAADIRRDLAVPKQSEVLRCAVEAGYLVAMADGEMDAQEREVMIKAIEVLSHGAVIEWETDSLISECEAIAKREGAQNRAKSVGVALKSLGYARVGLLFAAIIARVTKGVDKSEAEILKGVATAAGIPSDEVKNIVKRAQFTEPS
jgi:hypothetical protein